MPPVADYLRSLRDVRASGQAVPETSYYGTLEVYLNELGRGLRLRVRAIINLKNRGAGIPDGGLFSEDQLPGGDAVGTGGIPARGVLEVK